MKFERFLEILSNLIWGKYLIIALLGVGIYYSFATKFVQIRYFKQACFQMINSIRTKDKELEGTLTSFQALTNALASCVGNGNIVGVATAIASGGPGAIFWMWITGILGTATKYSEIVLGILYREKNEKGEYVGGPMYYISKGLNLKKLGIIFSFLMLFQVSGGGLIQSNALTEIIINSLNVNRYIVTFSLIFMVFLVIFGGIKRLGKVTEKLVPIMAILYLLGSFIVLFFNYENIFNVLNLIIKEAFKFNSLNGAAIGYSIKTAMRYGIARGLYSNEAGEGSAPVLHSTAKVKNAHSQGLMGIIEVFIDTIIICSTSAFVILSTNVYKLNISPTIYVLTAFENVNYYMRYIILITVVLFAYSTMISQWYFGKVTLNYIFNQKISEIYKYIFLVIIFLGSLTALNIVWLIQDIILGIMIVPNLLALILLRKKVLNELEKEKKC